MYIWVYKKFCEKLAKKGVKTENYWKILVPLFTTKTNGIGLGLAFTKILVEGHGGIIEVQSDTRKGSTFTISLPQKP